MKSRNQLREEERRAQEMMLIWERDNGTWRKVSATWRAPSRSMGWGMEEGIWVGEPRRFGEDTALLQAEARGALRCCGMLYRMPGDIALSLSGSQKPSAKAKTWGQNWNNLFITITFAFARYKTISKAAHVPKSLLQDCPMQVMSRRDCDHHTPPPQQSRFQHTQEYQTLFRSSAS